MSEEVVAQAEVPPDVGVVDRGRHRAHHHRHGRSDQDQPDTRRQRGPARGHGDPFGESSSTYPSPAATLLQPFCSSPAANAESVASSATGAPESRTMRYQPGAWVSARWKSSAWAVEYGVI